MTAAVIGATHVLCSIGNGTDQVWASARVGIGRIVNSGVMNRRFEPIQMGLVPETALSDLVPEIDNLPLPSRARRILALGAPSFLAAAKGLPGPIPVFIGLPELNHDEAPWLRHVPEYLQRLTGVQVDSARSAVVPYGRAAAFMALEQALAFLATGASGSVIVGGMDSYFDLRLLGVLDTERRILGPRVMDGFIPGEGAAFYTLSALGSSNAQTHGNRVVVNAAASAMDAGHRYGTSPARGEGLADALEHMRQRLGQPLSPVATTFAGFNGESFDAKLWGVARLRHNDFFSLNMVIEHPADKFGDAGAAMGAILIALAAKSLITGTRSGPVLAWAASDHDARACALVSMAAN